MRAESLLATVPTYIRHGGAWRAWLAWLGAFSFLAVGLLPTPSPMGFGLFLFLIALSAAQWGIHLFRLRALGRRHRWPRSESTQLTVALGWVILVLCLLPGAFAGTFGAPGLGVAVGAWAVTGMAVAATQVMPNGGLAYALLMSAFTFYPPSWPSPLELAAAPSPGTLALWSGAGAVGWLAAAAGFPLRFLVKSMGASRPASRSAAKPPFGAFEVPRSTGRRAPQGFVRRILLWQRGLPPWRWVSTAVLSCLFSSFFWGGSFEPFAGVVFLIPLLLPCLVACGAWEQRLRHLGAETLRPHGRRALAWELTGAVTVEVLLHWGAATAGCLVWVLVFGVDVPEAPYALGPYVLGTLLFQPITLLVTVGFLTLRPDQRRRRVGFGLATAVFGYVTLSISAVASFSWVISIAPGHSDWTPWATALALGLGAGALLAIVRHFEGLELGRFSGSATTG
ncbi:MAG: hypothetical protein AAGM22_28220 [Acidobacteriota bacterium]